MITWTFIVAFIQASMIFLFAGIGELFNQRSGVLNIGIDGLMIWGVLISFLVAGSTGNPWIGLLAGMASGAIVGLLHGFLSISLKVNQVISGMGIWLSALGMTTYFGAPFAGILKAGRLEKTIGGFTPLLFIGIGLVFLIWFILFRTSFGLRVRSVGENPSAAEVSGINVEKTRYICVIVGGILGGLSGAYLMLVYNPVWSPNPTMGRGWIALALVIFSLWKPIILMAGSLLFGFLWHLSLTPKMIFPILTGLPYHFFRMIPFIVTIVILVIISSGRIKRQIGAAKPEVLGMPYVRGE